MDNIKSLAIDSIIQKCRIFKEPSDIPIFILANVTMYFRCAPLETFTEAPEGGYNLLEGFRLMTSGIPQ